jgi:hypothetical protein
VRTLSGISDRTLAYQVIYACLIHTTWESGGGGGVGGGEVGLVWIFLVVMTNAEPGHRSFSV